MVKAEFNTDTGILHTTFDGEVKIKEILNYIEATSHNRAYPRKLKILTDASNAEYNFSPQDVHSIVKANNSSLVEFDYIIDAIITTDSKTTAITLLYQEVSRSNNYRFKLFSTREAAIQWLINSTD